MAKGIQQQQRNGCVLERLERRALFAGAVMAMVRDGMLRITGDDGANQMVISRDNDVRGTYRVEALGDTLLNGASAPLVFRNLRKGLFVDLGGGDDELKLSGAYVRGKLQINAGDGDDAVLLRSVRVTGTFDYDGGAGDDHILVRKSAFQNAINLDGGEGKDRTTLSFVDALHELSIEDTQGASILSFTRLLVERDAMLVAGNSLDRVMIHDSRFQSHASMGLHNGDDELRVRGTIFEETPILDAGAGENQIDRELILEWDFNDGAQGWTGGFADYPAGQIVGTKPDGSPLIAEELYDLQSGIESLPSELGIDGAGFKLSGFNWSDALFMYLQRELGPEDGITPNTRYQIRIRLEFATDFPGSALSVSPFLKFGGTSETPALVPEDTGLLILYRLNADIGSNGNSGADASVAGRMHSDDLQELPSETWGVAAREHTHTAPVIANAQGRLWLIIGADSVYETLGRMYAISVEVRLTPQ